MFIQIENDNLSAKINSVGAELSSLISKNRQLELIWDGKPEFWARHAPILFPIVGKLAKNQYLCDEKAFYMNQHGFARDTEFKIEKQLLDRILFSLKANEETQKKYPFKFELLVEYSLKGNKLTSSYKVNNLGEKQMPFSLGAHPAFRCPLEPGGAFEDYFLEFEKNETGKRYLLQDGLLEGASEYLLEDDNILPLNYSLFEKDAIILKNLKSRCLRLKSNHFPAEILLEFAGFPFFGIWTKPNAPFVCLEPWHGLADTSTTPAEIRKKEGIILLPPRESKTFHFSISLKLPQS